jgi:hypothetical protein
MIRNPMMLALGSFFLMLGATWTTVLVASAVVGVFWNQLTAGGFVLALLPVALLPTSGISVIVRSIDQPTVVRKPGRDQDG